MLCFPLSPLSISGFCDQMLVPRSQMPDATVDDDPYYTERVYYYVQGADDQE